MTLIYNFIKVYLLLKIKNIKTFLEKTKAHNILVYLEVLVFRLRTKKINPWYIYNYETYIHEIKNNKNLPWKLRFKNLKFNLIEWKNEIILRFLILWTTQNGHLILKNILLSYFSRKFFYFIIYLPLLYILIYIPLIILWYPDYFSWFNNYYDIYTLNYIEVFLWETLPILYLSDSYLKYISQTINTGSMFLDDEDNGYKFSLNIRETWILLNLCGFTYGYYNFVVSDVERMKLSAFKYANVLFWENKEWYNYQLYDLYFLLTDWDYWWYYGNFFYEAIFLLRWESPSLFLINNYQLINQYDLFFYNYYNFIELIKFTI